MNRSAGKRVLLLVAALALTACSAPARRPDGSRFAPDFSFSSFAKTDIDVVAEIHYRETFLSLRTLMDKLYKRNPREWRKTGQPSPEAILAMVFDTRHNWGFRELDYRRGTQAIQLAFSEEYAGDRVLAFVVGLATMTQAAYNDKTEFFALEELIPQKLYNCARNYETAAWKLNHDRNARGEPFLLGNETDGAVKNLSFEREFGKLVAHQDTLARIAAEKNNRTVIRVIQSVATVMFLPI